jgi:hypothetical protein
VVGWGWQWVEVGGGGWVGERGNACISFESRFKTQCCQGVGLQACSLKLIAHFQSVCVLVETSGVQHQHEAVKE